MLKVDTEYTKGRCEICSKLTIRTLERRHRRRSGVFIVIFELISHFFLVFLMQTTLGKQMPAGKIETKSEPPKKAFLVVVFTEMWGTLD